MKCPRARNFLIKKYMSEFDPFFKKVIQIMVENHKEKGDSWKTISWANLMDNLSNQFEDMQDDPHREDYYGNIGCYAAMLWNRARKEK